MNTSLTLEQNARELLDSYALFPAQIDSIMTHAKESDANESMKDRWNDKVSSYSTVTLNVLRLSIITAAIEWLESNLPQAWMIPALKASLNPSQP